MMGLEPIYISETVEKTMNPTFRNINLSACGPGITRLDHVVVKVWIRATKDGEKSGRWRQLSEIEVGLRDLQFLGKNVNFTLPMNIDPILTRHRLMTSIVLFRQTLYSSI